MKGDRTKKRPRRLFYDEETDRYFYLVNKKKKYIKMPKGRNITDKKLAGKKIANINIRQIVNVPSKKQNVRPRSSIKPVLNQQIVSRLESIGLAQNLQRQNELFTGQEKLLRKIEKLEEKSKPVDVKPPVKEENKPPIKEEVKLPKKSMTERFLGAFKAPKPTNASVLVEAERIRKERENDERELEERKFIEEDEEAIDDGFKKTNPNLELFGKDEGIIEAPKSSSFFSALTKTQWKLDDDFRGNLKSIVSNWNYVDTDEEIKQAFTNFSTTTSSRTDKKGITLEKFRTLLKQVQREKNPEEKEDVQTRRISFIGPDGNIRTTGRGSYSNDNDGIYSDELQEIFEDETNRFLPVIASDQMDTLIPMVNRDTEKFGWIQNTEPSGDEGRHWVAYFIDIPNLEVNYYDSLVENDGIPPRSSLKGLKKIIDKIHPEYYLLFKHNQIRDQNPNSANCGYFAIKFLMDRFRGVSFRKATGYSDLYGNGVVDNYVEGEQKIKRFKNYL